QQITQIIQTSTEPQIMLSKIAQELGIKFKAYACLIVAGIGPTDRLQAGLWRADTNTLIEPNTKTQLLSHPLVKEILAGTEPLAICDLEGTKNWFEADWLKEILPVGAALSIATSFQGTVNGMIIIGKSEIQDWHNSEKELLKITAESVAIAISVAQLQQQTQITNKYQRLLNDLSNVIRHSGDLDSLLNLALGGTAKALQVDRGLILMLKYNDPLYKSRTRRTNPKAKAQVLCQWSADDLPSSPSNSSFRLAECSLCQQALENAPQSLAIAEQKNLEKIPAIFQPETMSAYLMMPLTRSHGSKHSKSFVLGFLVLQCRQSHSWQADEIQLVNWVSAQVSTAIIQNQALHQVQSIVKEQTAKLKWSLDVQGKLSAKMRKQIKQLRQLNDLKDDFLSSMSHELKTPLTTMKMAIKMLRQPGLSEKVQERYLNILEQEWNRENNLIKDLLTLQELESDKFTLHPQELDLKEIISDLAQSFEEKWHGNKSLTLAVAYDKDYRANHDSSESPLMLYTDSESFQHILDELLLNAGKYSDPDTTVNLDAGYQITPKGKKIIITLTNYGAGISPDEQAHIFDKFHRGKGVTDRAVPGTGLGLALVKSLVQHLDGTIEVSSNYVENSATFVTTFTLTLPQFKIQL
ncbi:MAG: GAF domain-containing sensor histidine kinase, partial [Moorea sp. SIO2B7]|nr:GAF domain-containing sensor histidine kinase [Moorena sp. SIO2B7]